MEIIENQSAWEAAYRTGWLAHHQQTGEFNWKLYQRPKNSSAPAGPAIDLEASRIVLISSAGGYLAASQEPFDAPNPYGDYTIRTFPIWTSLSAVAYAHEHYDHAAVNADPQVLLPLQHMDDMVGEGILGEVAPRVISFSGYQPDAARVVDELIPAILAEAKAQYARGAILVPS